MPEPVSKKPSPPVEPPDEGDEESGARKALHPITFLRFKCPQPGCTEHKNVRYYDPADPPMCPKHDKKMEWVE